MLGEEKRPSRVRFLGGRRWGPDVNTRPALMRPDRGPGRRVDLQLAPTNDNYTHVPGVVQLSGTVFLTTEYAL